VSLETCSLSSRYSSSNRIPERWVELAGHDQTVARQAGVSTQTVSRVLNDRPDVAAETRDRVKEVIGQLGYRPSLLPAACQRRSYTLVW